MAKATKTTKAAAGTKSEKVAVEKFSHRARFSTAKGAKLDVQAKRTEKGYKVSVLLRKAPKNGDDKPKAERGMVTMHQTEAEAMAKLEQLVADASKNGWKARQTVTRSSFDAMPKAEAV